MSEPKDAHCSMEIQLVNATPYTFRRSNMKVDWGIWSHAGALVPPEQILPNTRGYFASESEGFNTGTQGQAIYDTDKGQISIDWNVPSWGGAGFDVHVPHGIARTYNFSSAMNIFTTVVFIPEF